MPITELFLCNPTNHSDSVDLIVFFFMDDDIFTNSNLRHIQDKKISSSKSIRLEIMGNQSMCLDQWTYSLSSAGTKKRRLKRIRLLSSCRMNTPYQISPTRALTRRRSISWLATRQIRYCANTLGRYYCHFSQFHTSCESFQRTFVLHISPRFVPLRGQKLRTEIIVHRQIFSLGYHSAT